MRFPRNLRRIGGKRVLGCQTRKGSGSAESPSALGVPFDPSGTMMVVLDQAPSNEPDTIDLYGILVQ
jgi:hypothetical protein